MEGRCRHYTRRDKGEDKFVRMLVERVRMFLKPDISEASDHNFLQNNNPIGDII
jgi:hypothetical protein